MINQVLGAPEKNTYLHNNRDLLRQQARTFYTSIIHSVAPDVTVKFDFTGRS